MKATACAILALLALAVVAQTSEAAFCRTSSYKVAPSLAKGNKEAMFKACVDGKEITKAPVIYKVETKNGCALIYQKVDNAAAWDAYSNCEKSKNKVNNTKYYEPLSKQSGPCENNQKKGNC